ncbi:MAG: GntR family transcriptional regulator [Lentisphaeria bacterium]|nr:GntR family transcriptional regulator [Lentisphaeria bacterium]
MLRKSSALADLLIREIEQGHWQPGMRIPSRNALTLKYQCSRTTVERAVAQLTAAGYLTSSKGSGTFAASAVPSAKTGIRHVYLLSSFDIRSSADFAAETLFNRADLGVPVDWVRPEQFEIYFEKIARPGNAVIWIMPFPEYLYFMRCLADRHIPQLLINREYLKYDRVCTDAEAGIREGLSWLLIESGREMAVVMRRAGMDIPYQFARTAAFYKLALELGAHLPAEWIFEDDMQDIARATEEIGACLFGGRNPARGIFVMDCRMAVPLLVCARGYGLQPGRDFRMLTFDYVAELDGTPGVAMMRQPYDRFLAESRRWLERCADCDRPVFSALCKTELIVPK